MLAHPGQKADYAPAYNAPDIAQQISIKPWFELIMKCI